MAGQGVARPAGGTPAEPLHLLYEEPGLPRWGLRPALAMTYGGDLGFTQPCVYGNFVASLDRVVALGPEDPSSGSAVSGHEPADRFVMGLLRACADAVLIGAGTLRATPGHRWTPAHSCSAAAANFADLRRSLRRAAQPELVVDTAASDVPAEHPALQADALVATTTAGALRIDGRLPDPCTVLAVGEGSALGMTEMLLAIRARRHAAVLTEGGPRLLGHLVGGGLLDELFLTVSPVLAGRADTPRPGLITGLALLPDRPQWTTLISARQPASYLSLRYRLHPHRPHRPHWRSA
jgi:riboflavin biosynthesis pyrimidine reductase